MLETTRAKLTALYAGGEHRGTDGELHAIDSITRISLEQGEMLANIHQKMRPKLSVEVGLAYGFSTLYILDAMQAGGYGHHIAIDPGADSHWHGVGLAAINEAGLSQRFEWLATTSDVGLAKLIADKRRAQFVYIDGCHFFEVVLADFFLSNKIVGVGGVIILDDLWMPAIKRVVSYISTNMRWYERVDVGSSNIACFRKIDAQDDRRWDHYVDF